MRLPRDPAPQLPLAPTRIPGSKSVTNRALLTAALAPGRSVLRGGLEAEDTHWMRTCLGACGVTIDEAPDGWTILGGHLQPPELPLRVGASGTTLRFLLPALALWLDGPVRLEGDPRLFERPLGPLLRALAPLGVAWAPEGNGGVLTPCTARPRRVSLEVEASLSSQFITGLALAAASLPEGGTLRWSGPAASPSYLELTAHGLRRFGCDTHLFPGRWELPGGRLRPRDLEITGDWSGAAAFLCAGAVTGRAVTLAPLDPQEPQGDRALLDILEAAGCAWTAQGVHVQLTGRLQRGLQADLSTCPDLGPVLAATAALAPGPSTLTGLHTLPHKECDRLEASAELVRWLGGDAEVEGDHTLRIKPGPEPAIRGAFDPRNDHRMAFAAAVGALHRGGTLDQPGCVAKTFPTFWEVWERFLAG